MMSLPTAFTKAESSFSCSSSCLVFCLIKRADFCAYCIVVIKQSSQGYKLGKTSVTLTSPNQHHIAFERCDKPFSYLIACMIASVSKLIALMLEISRTVSRFSLFAPCCVIGSAS